MNQRKVLIDMDGVMADFDSAALANVPKGLLVPKSQFYIARDYPSEIHDSIERVYHTPGFFENLEPMPGLYEAWQTMIDNGYKPQVASAPLSSNRTSTEEKVKWLDRVMVPEFGVGVVEDAILDKEKWKYSALAIIDDNPVIAKGPEGRHSAEWEHVLFGWSHLQTVPLATAAFRLLDWRDTGQLIETLDTISEKRTNPLP